MTFQVIEPLEQFEINIIFHLICNIIGDFVIHIIITNSLLYLLFTLGIFLILFSLSNFKLHIIPTKYQLFVEYIYKFVCDLLLQHIGKEGLLYIPLIFVTFTFILISNLIGATPYGFTVTSHIVKTFTASLAIFLALTLMGFIFQSYKFLNLFVPKNVPSFLLPFLVIIEIVSYISRAFSLAIRLFANMMAGHALLFILASFAFMMYTQGASYERVFAIMPFVLMLAIIILEIGIAFLQAYVFAVLICIYLNDSYHADH